MVPIGRLPPDRIRAFLLHFAGGILLAVVCVEIWPDVDSADRPLPMLAGLLAGGTLMIGLNALTHRLERRPTDAAALPVGLMAAAGIDSVVDGMLIGIGYAAQPELGLLLAAGLGVEKFTITMCVASELREADQPRRRIVACAAVMALALIPSAILGHHLLADAAGAPYVTILSAAAAALLYLVTVELMARGQDTHASPGAILCFFAGFTGLAAFEALTPI